MCEDPGLSSYFSQCRHRCKFQISQLYHLTEPTLELLNAIKVLEKDADEPILQLLKELLSQCYECLLDDKVPLRQATLRTVKSLKRDIFCRQWDTDDNVRCSAIRTLRKRFLLFHILIMLNWIQCILLFTTLTRSRFSHHLRLFSFLRRVRDFEDCQGIGGRDGGIYLFCSIESGNTYIGQTSKGFCTRFYRQHVKGILGLLPPMDMLPAYRRLKQAGNIHSGEVADYFVVGLSSADVATSRLTLEKRLIMLFQPNLNSCARDGQNQLVIRTSRKRKKVIRAKDHKYFANTTTSLPFLKLDIEISPNIFIDKRSFLERLSMNKKHRFQKYHDLLKKLSTKIQSDLFNITIREFKGTQRRKLLFILKNSIPHKFHYTIPILFTPYIHTTRLFKSFLAKSLRQKSETRNRLFIITLKFKYGQSLAQIVSNQTAKNKLISSPPVCSCQYFHNFFPDRCFVNGHLWAQTSDNFFGNPFRYRNETLKEWAYYPIKTRVTPTPNELSDSLHEAVDKLKIFKNDSSHIPAIKSIISSYSRFYHGCDIIKRERFDIFRQNYQDLILARQVDKEATRGGILCMVHYHAIALPYKGEKVTSAFYTRAISQFHTFLQSTKSTTGKKFSADSLIASHKFGNLEIWPKKSGGVRGRPLVSYKKHCLRDLLSIATKAGMFLVKFCIPDKIGKLDGRLISADLNQFNINLNGSSFDTSPGVGRGKTDVGNFFNKIKREEAIAALDWLFTIFRDSKKGRYKFIKLPKLHHGTEMELRVQKKFGPTIQGPNTRGQPHFRRLIQEKLHPHFCNSLDVDDRGLCIEDLRKIIVLDVQFGCYTYGTEVRTEHTLPQGSPGSFLLAEIVAEYRLFQARDTWKSLHSTYNFSSIILERWVDDLFFFFAIDRNRLTHETSPDMNKVVSEAEQSILQWLREDVFYDFELKIEDPDICVGLEIKVLNDEKYIGNLADRKIFYNFLSFSPKIQLYGFPHFKSNFPVHVFKGLIKACLIRTIDQSSSFDEIKANFHKIRSAFTMYSEVPDKIFRQTFYDLQKRTTNLHQIFYEMYDQG